MPQRKRSNRDLGHYSDWHRYPTLPHNHYLVDTDFFEMRGGLNGLVPVACFEIMEIGALFLPAAQQTFPLWEAKKILLLYLKRKLAIPLFVVRYTPDCKLFAVSRLTDSGEETEQIILDEGQYKTLLMSL